MPHFFSDQLNCFLLSDEDMRDIILGRVIYGQCLQCNGSGRENWNEDGFGNVLNLETEIYDVRDGFSGQPPESREYFKAVLDQVDE